MEFTLSLGLLSLHVMLHLHGPVMNYQSGPEASMAPEPCGPGANSIIGGDEIIASKNSVIAVCVAFYQLAFNRGLGVSPQGVGGQGTGRR